MMDPLLLLIDLPENRGVVFGHSVAPKQRAGLLSLSLSLSPEAPETLLPMPPD
jgi:hypothetical protein